MEEQRTWANQILTIETSMKRHRSEYEVILLGSGVGGLAAGTLLSKKNFNVLLLKENRYHSSFEKEGYRFIPFSSFSEKRLNINFLKKISQMLSLSLQIHDREGDKKKEKKGEKLRQHVAFQVILPKSRIDLFSHWPMFQKELEREFPGEVAQIEQFFNEVEHLQHLLKEMKTKEGPDSIFPLQRRSQKKKWFSFESLPKGRMDERLTPFSREFKEFIQLQLISWGNLYSDQFPISLAAYLLLDHETNESVSNVDLERVKKSLYEKYFQSGGMVEEIEGVEEVKKRWRKGFTLSLKGGSRAFQAKFLIFNSPLHNLSNLLDQKEKLLSKWEEKIKPRYALLPLFLGIREKVVPVGMRNLLVSILDPEKPYEGGNILFIALSLKGDEAEAPKGKRALTVESLLPVGKWDQNSLMDHQKRVMEHLHYLFPFLENNIEFTDCSWANEHISCWSYPHFLYEATPDFQWREGVVPSCLSKNLYFIGKENFPYLGVQGEILNGLMVAQQILQTRS